MLHKIQSILPCKCTHYQEELVYEPGCAFNWSMALSNKGIYNSDIVLLSILLITRWLSDSCKKLIIFCCCLPVFIVCPIATVLVLFTHVVSAYYIPKDQLVHSEVWWLMIECMPAIFYVSIFKSCMYPTCAN